MKTQKLFSLTAEVFSQVVRVVREVSQLDDRNRVLVRPVSGAVVFSCVGSGMFLNYAAPAEVENETPVLLNSNDLIIVNSGVKATREIQKTAPIHFHLEKRRGGSKIIINFESLYSTDVKVSNVKRISTRSLESAPALPAMPKEDRIPISSEDFVIPLSRVHSVATEDNNNPSFCGCYFKLTGEELIVAATDGVRLTEVRKNVKSDHVGDCILPQRFCAKAVKIIPTETDLELHMSDRLFFVKSPSTVFGTTRINAPFPEYSSLITDKETYVEIDSSVLLDCLSGFASLVSVDQYKRISLYFDAPSLSIESMGFSTFDIPLVESFVPRPLSLDVNLNLFNMLVRSISSDVIRIGFEDDTKPIILEPVGCDFSHVALLVPLVRG